MGIFSAAWDAIAGVGNQLSAEKNKATLTGPKEDVEAIVKVDRQIGKIMGEFNAATRIPNEVTDGIEKLLKQNAKSFSRVLAKKAYKEDTLESFGTWWRGDKTTTEVPVDWLEYEHVYRSPTGGRIEQRVAQVRVGK